VRNPSSQQAADLVWLPLEAVMPSLTLHFAHRRPLEGRPLGLIWLGLIVGSWTGAFLFARLVIWAGTVLLP